MWVLCALEIWAEDPRPNRYVLAVERANEMLGRFVSDAGLPEEFGYVGTWHSHPSDSGPSPLDLATLRQDSLGQGHATASLVIVRRDQERWEHNWLVADGRDVGTANVRNENHRSSGDRL